MRRAGRLFWKLFLINLLLLGSGLAVFLWLAFGEFETFHETETEKYLRAEATLITNHVAEQLGESTSTRLNRSLRQLVQHSPVPVQVTVLDPQGRAIADTERAISLLPTFHDDLMQTARREGVSTGYVSRGAGDSQVRDCLVVTRIGSAERPLGFVRTRSPSPVIGGESGLINDIVLLLLVILLLMAVVLAFGLTRIWSDPIRRITSAARNLSRGALAARVEIRGNDEVGLLGLALNRMGDRLKSTMSTINRQRLTLEALLAQLQEGIIVAGADGRIVLCNPTATRLLHPGEEFTEHSASWVGKAIEAVVPQHDLQLLLLPKPVAEDDAGLPAGAAGLLAHRAAELRLQIRGENVTRTVLARASDIALPSGPDGESNDQRRDLSGRILALTDITELDRLIQMKTDFVANASHELRTPLSVIRAAVETLMEIDPSDDPEAVDQFLRSINRHTTRLEAMVGDLLDLSRLESTHKKFEPEALQINVLLDDLLMRFHENLADKELRWESQTGGVTGRALQANRHLIDLILDNLISNAIKFTEPRGLIKVTAHYEDEEAIITVADTGCGIRPEEQARIFERFYQVERSRSGMTEGAQRGTGLGLSIVRHAAAALGGTVHLNSQVGVGTRVELRIPISASR